MMIAILCHDHSTINAKTHFIGLDLLGLRRGSSTRKRLKGNVGEDMHCHVMSRLTGNVPICDPVEKEAMRLLLEFYHLNPLAVVLGALDEPTQIP